MIKFLVINGKYAIPLDRVSEIRTAKIAGEGEGVVISTPYRELFLRHQELVDVVKSIHGFQRSNDSTFHYLPPEPRR